MEVASIITNRKFIIELFEDFIFSYHKLKLQEKDDNTAYFSNCIDNKLEIYYHYLLNNVEQEFSYNYSSNDIDRIRGYFQESNYFIFDLSFRTHSFFKELIRDFCIFLNTKGYGNEGKQVLISDPFDGIVELNHN